MWYFATLKTSCPINNWLPQGIEKQLVVVCSVQVRNLATHKTAQLICDGSWCKLQTCRWWKPQQFDSACWAWDNQFKPTNLFVPFNFFYERKARQEKAFVEISFKAQRVMRNSQLLSSWEWIDDLCTLCRLINLGKENNRWIFFVARVVDFDRNLWYVKRSWSIKIVSAFLECQTTAKLAYSLRFDDLCLLIFCESL